MKKLLKTSAAFFLAAAFAMTSCKGKDNSETVDGTESDTVMTTEPDTTATDAGTLNDTNASGTTSGEMEQVP